MPSGHKSDRRGLRSPSKRKRLGNVEPSATITCAVVRAHARTLTVVADGVPTSGRALFHLTVGLNDVEPSVSFQATVDETVEPARIRTHNQNMTVAARAIAERKTVGDLS